MEKGDVRVKLTVLIMQKISRLRIEAGRCYDIYFMDIEMPDTMVWTGNLHPYEI